MKKGTYVQLKLRTDDIAHGLELEVYAEGVREDGGPGLLFEHPQGKAKGKKGQESVTEFCGSGRY